MKTSQAARRIGNGRHRPTPPPLPLNVFVGYADLPAFRRATAAIGEGVRAHGRRIELRPLLWGFDQLGQPRWRDRAIAAALEADVVVLASSTPSGLTAQVEAWISSYLEAAHGRRTTLVVISGPSDAWTISLELPRRSENRVAPLGHWAHPRPLIVQPS